jgi:hypothetical protein
MKPYYEIGKKSTIFKDLQDFAFSPSEWVEHYNFDAKRIPPEIIFQDDFFIWLSHRYSFVAGVLKLDPYTCYDWHTDTRRGVGVNMLLTTFDRSVCAFAPNKEGIVFEIEELKYKPSTYYIFNTQMPHTVYNFETTRYLMSIEFAKDKDQLTFEDLVKDIRNNYEKNCTE